MMKRYKPISYIILAAAFALVTFFGLGPVLLADGRMGERLLNLVVVIVIYIIIFLLFIRINRHKKG